MYFDRVSHHNSANNIFFFVHKNHTHTDTIDDQTTSPSQSPIEISSDTDNGVEYPIGIFCNTTLRKVAETMFLKDPQYKPHMNSQTYGKSNPFTTLTQLKGVKKIIGANPSTYTAGVCDLFSSCFEIRVTKDTATGAFPQRTTNGKTGKTVQQAKSLPSSPKITQRKLSKIDKFVLQQTSSKINNSSNNNSNNEIINDIANNVDDDDLLFNSKTKMINSDNTIERKKLELLDVPNQCQTNNVKHCMVIGNDSTMDYSNNEAAILSSRTGTLKKKNASSLFSHPLFKCKDDHRDDSYYFDNPKLLTRGGSSESGFFSCLTDEDFSTHRPLAKLSINGPCDYEHTLHYMDDRSNATAATTTTIPNSLRSFDDFDLFERNATCCKFDCSGNDSLSIDMGLVNRLSLDSEINSLFHKHQLNNQLLYCKNRTSSIYTDSSEDISSLAGSDSLLWDDRMSSYSTTIPNTRSAQIAKIVEYFERKGQTFMNSTNSTNCTLSADRHHISSISSSDYTSVTASRTYLPSSSNRCSIYLRNNNNTATAAAAPIATTTSTATTTTTAATTTTLMATTPALATNHMNASNILSSDNTNYTVELNQTQSICGSGTNGGQASSSSSSPSTAYQTTNPLASTTSKEYEAFCLDLDKSMATPQRINVCEGVVKSKLQLFDKLRKN